MQTRSSAKKASAPASQIITSTKKTEVEAQAPSSQAAGPASSVPSPPADTATAIAETDASPPLPMSNELVACISPVSSASDGSNDTSTITVEPLNPPQKRSLLFSFCLRILEVLALSLAFAILALTLSRFANVFVLHYYAALPLKAAVFIPQELHRRVEQLLVPLQEGGFAIAGEAIAVGTAVKPRHALGWSAIFLLCLGWICGRFLVLLIAAMRFIARRYGWQVVVVGNTCVLGTTLATWVWLYSGYW